MQKGSEKIGSEYILEIVGNENGNKNKKYLFNCIICKSEVKLEEIEEHKVSNEHRLAFLVRIY
jgi:hypothetical protein